MDPARLQEILARKRAEEAAAPGGPALTEVEPFRVPAQTSELARDILDAAPARRLSGGELLVLFEEAALPDLAAAAHASRRLRADPEVATYLLEASVVTTGRAAGPGEGGAAADDREDRARLLSRDEVLVQCRTAAQAGGHRIRLHGSFHPGASIEFWVELLGTIRAEFTELRVHGLSPEEVQHAARTSGMATREALAHLRAAGLHGLAGDAGLLSDRVRALVTPDSRSSDDWLATMEEAHGVGLAGGLGMEFRHVETYPERVAHLIRSRESQDRTGGYREFVSRPMPDDHPRLEEWPEFRAQVEKHGQTAALDHLRTLAISRIALDNLPVIQSSCDLPGGTIGQLGLLHGASELLVTLPVTAAAPEDIAGRRALTPADLEALITGVGFRAMSRSQAGW
ncbi:MAG: hypothetical protein R6X25_09280 [Candidatus Krumholzibacteriia bacterium]